jgi:drug/metabolite transporter (DMT)-like permease
MDMTSGERDLDSARITVVQLAVVCLAMVAASSVIGASPIEVAAQFDAVQWMLVIYLALACTVFAFFVQLWAVRSTSPSRVSLLLGTEPLWAVVVGVCLAGEPLTLVVGLGAACILTGAVLGRRSCLDVGIPIVRAAAAPRSRRSSQQKATA